MKVEQIIPLIDLTTLNATDGINAVNQITKQAVALKDLHIFPASVCVYPTLVKQVRHQLPQHITVASVSGGFPAGQTPIKIKIEESKIALEEGAAEIDMAINRARLIDGEDNYIHDEIAAVKEVCGARLLKVIIESGELGSENLIRKATQICMQAGADFVKTSTGKSAIGATPEAVRFICEEIAFNKKSKGVSTGIKISGGIATPEHAINYIKLVSSLLGSSQIVPGLFRIGASRLYNQLLSLIQLNK